STGALVYGNRTVWYTWTAGGADTGVEVNTLGSNFDTMVGVYTGNAVNALTRITFADDIVPNSQTTSRARFHAFANTVYQIAVTGKDLAQGNFTLNLITGLTIP